MNRRRTSRRNARGFSMVEMLVAAVLMSIIFASLSTVTSQWLPNWSRGFLRAQQTELVALGVERLVADLAAAEIVPVNRATPPYVFEGTELSVTFVRTILGPNAGPGLEIVRVAQAGDDRGPLLVRARAPYVLSNDENRESARPNFTDPVVLLRGPYRVFFAYAGEDRIWRDTWSATARLPRAIRITVRDAASGRTLPVSTIATIHAEVPASCVLTKAIRACLPNQGTPSARDDEGNPAAPGRQL